MRHSSDHIRELERIVRTETLDYNVFFRRRSEEFRRQIEEGSYDSAQATDIPVDAMPGARFRDSAELHVDTISEYFREVIMSPDSADLMWSLYCTPSRDAHSLLCAIVPDFDRIARTVRGGPNLYKLCGWVVHVLFGYSVLAKYLPAGRLPKTFEWSDAILGFWSGTCGKLYSGLSRSDLFLLRSAFLGHDIGVQVKIAKHDEHGVHLVDRFLLSIRLDRESVAAAGFEGSYEDYKWAVRLLVRYHTLLNRIGGELGLTRADKIFREIERDCAESSWRKEFLATKLAPLLLLVGVADLLAVDESLLTERKALEIVDALNAGTRIINHGIEPGSERTVARERLRVFLAEPEQIVSTEALEAEVSRYGLVPSTFLETVARLGEMHFAVPVLRFILDAHLVVRFFVIVTAYLTRVDRQSNPDLQDLELVISPTIEASELEAALGGIDSGTISNAAVSQPADNMVIGDLILETVMEERTPIVTVNIVKR